MDNWRPSGHLWTKEDLQDFYGRTKTSRTSMDNRRPPVLTIPSESALIWYDRMVWESKFVLWYVDLVQTNPSVCLSGRLRLKLFSSKIFWFQKMDDMGAWKSISPNTKLYLVFLRKWKSFCVHWIGRKVIPRSQLNLYRDIWMAYLAFLLARGGFLLLIMNDLHRAF